MFSMIVKAGRRRTVVGWSFGGSVSVAESDGTGMFEAESFSFWGFCVR